MKDNFEERLKNMAEKEASGVPRLPEGFEHYVEEVLEGLPERRRRRIGWKGTVALAAAMTAMMSITVTAAVSYVRQRMEALAEDEKLEYYAEARYITAADFYSRPLTEGEEARMDSLSQSYRNEGLFPEGELSKITDSSEYGGLGVAFLPSRSTFFLPEGELSDEELLQIIDFRAKREYSLQEVAAQEAAGGTEAPDRIAAPKEEKVTLNAQDQEIAYEGEGQLYLAAASADAAYVGSASELYRLDNGSDRLVRLDVEAPEGMGFARLTTDAEGNLNVILTRQGLTLEDAGPVRLWKLSPEGSLIEELDASAVGDGKGIRPQAFAMDSEGRYYISAVRSPLDEGQYIYVLDGDGRQISVIENKNGDMRALGRGKDGRVYGVLMEGEDWIPAVVTFDVENGKLGEKYEGVLPGVNGAYTIVSAGTDSDLLIWGMEGVYSYHLGDKKAQMRRPQYELPGGAVLAVLPDGRGLFVSDELPEGGSVAEARTKCIYLIKL